MKKIQNILLIILLVMPILVFAETCDTNSIKIDSLKIKETNGNAKEKVEATKNGTEINVNLDMQNVGDSIIYEALLKNDSDEDYYLDESYLIVDTDYMEYSITSSDDSNIIKANSSKTFNVKLKYRKEVEESSYESGKYTDRNNLSLNLKTESKNPYTSDYIALYLAIFYLSVFGLMYLFIKKKKTEELTILLLINLLVPLSVNALCKTEIKVNSIINIEKRELATFHISCSPIEYKYYKGMTFGEWIKSDLYEDNIDGTFHSLKDCEGVYGKNRGCAYTHKDSPYIIDYSTYNYYEKREECRYPDECEEINNEAYKATLSNNIYDTFEECNSINEGDICKKINDKYMAIITNIYANEEQCNSYINTYSYEYSVCSIVPKAYREKYYSISEFRTYESCSPLKRNEDDCKQVTFDYFSPTIKENPESRGKFILTKSYSYYENIEGQFLFDYRDKIQSDYAYDCIGDN